MTTDAVIIRDLNRAAELSDLAEELREAAVTIGRHPSTHRPAGNRYRAVAGRLAELLRDIEYRAWVLAPPRTPRAKRDGVRSEVLTTTAGLPADSANRLRLPVRL